MRASTVGPARAGMELAFDGNEIAPQSTRSNAELIPTQYQSPMYSDLNWEQIASYVL